MTEFQKTKENASDSAPEDAGSPAEKAKAALAGAVARRNEARRQNDRGAAKAPHGGKPVSDLKVSHQIRGK